MNPVEQEQRVVPGAVQLRVRVLGEGPPVLLIPSLGRGAQDFTTMAGVLANAGYRALALDPRGIGDSRGSLAGANLHDLAADAAGVIAAQIGTPVWVVGHAFGNRVARCLAADAPQWVRGLILLGAGGQVPPTPAALAAFRVILNGAPGSPAWREAVYTANFATGSDPSPWFSGWWLDTARQQVAAAHATPVSDWWNGGEVPMLVIQGLEDRMAPPGNGHLLQETLPGRVELVEIAAAGHALLPEQPAAVADAVLAYLAPKYRSGG